MVDWSPPLPHLPAVAANRLPVCAWRLPSLTLRKRRRKKNQHSIMRQVSFPTLPRKMLDWSHSSVWPMLDSHALTPSDAGRVSTTLSAVAPQCFERIVVNMVASKEFEERCSNGTTKACGQWPFFIHYRSRSNSKQNRKIFCICKVHNGNNYRQQVADGHMVNKSPKGWSWGGN